ncbi:ComEC/Rec2 family competence protein [Candidatus Saccharibacteria bacterium]|nr:ComEC/Rec2 family competence protein [Candidatus Saccharibacteria bacterium]
MRAGRQKFRVTTILSVGLTAFLSGLVGSHYIGLTLDWRIGAFLLIIAILVRFKNKLSLLSIVIIGGFFGLLRGAQFRQTIMPYKQLTGKVIKIRASVVSDAVYADKGQLEFDVSNIQIITPINSKLPGTIGIRGYGESMIYRGDSVIISAKLYSARGSRQGRMSFARISRLHNSGSYIDRIRRRYSAGLLSAIPEPHGSLGLGILIGQRTTLPDWLNDSMSIVGLTHIVAVSGYNLTIMVRMAQRLTRKRSKYQATITMLLFIFCFIGITGSSASIVRAGIVSLLSIWAWYYGRTFRPHLIILLSASMTAGWFPAYLWSDLGWHLSFLAFIGVLLLAPIFTLRFFKTKPKIYAQLFIETVSAQILTLPIILYSFGRFSSVALLANLLVVPIVPIAMLLSFVAGLAGVLSLSVVGWLSWPAVAILRYMIDCVVFLAKVPGASSVVYLSFWQVVVGYLVVVFLMVVWWRKTSKNGKIKDIYCKPLTEPVVSSGSVTIRKERYERT